MDWEKRKLIRAETATQKKTIEQNIQNGVGH